MGVHEVEGFVYDIIVHVCEGVSLSDPNLLYTSLVAIRLLKLIFLLLIQ
jgi:hypothetical protein